MKVRKLSISLKIFMAVIALLVVSDLLIGFLVYQRAETILVNQIRENAMNIDRCVAASVDGYLLRKVQAGDENTAAYETLKEQMALFRDNSGVEYVYTIRDRGDGMTEFVVDTDEEEPGLPGEEFEALSEQHRLAYAGQTSADTEPYTDEWGTHISAYSPVYDGDEIVGLAVVDLNVDWVKAQTGQIAILITGICIGVLVVGIVILMLISSRLRAGFVTLDEKIVELVHGNGDLTKVIQISTGDEMETIAEHINQLIQFIHGILVRIEKDSMSLQQISGVVTDHMKNASGDVNDVSATMEELTASMEEIASSTNQVNELIGQITESFQEMVTHINGGSDFSHSMNAQAQEIGQNATKEQAAARKELDELADSVKTTIVNAKAVDQIQILTSSILEITDQTNMLSLNASIEAARAGEAGRGFAVVASQISELAQRSATAASEIQTVSNTVISAVNALADEARRMVDFVKQTTEKGYGDLVETAGAYQTGAEQIDGIMQNCAKIAEDIRKSMQEALHFTEGVSEASSEAAIAVTSATQRTVDMSGCLVSAEECTKESNECAARLSKEVSNFKL